MGQEVVYNNRHYSLSDDPKKAREQLADIKDKLIEREKRKPLEDSPAVKLKQITGDPYDYFKSGYLLIGTIPGTKMPLFQALDNDEDVVDLYDNKYTGKIELLNFQQPMPTVSPTPIPTKEKKDEVEEIIVSKTVTTTTVENGETITTTKKELPLKTAIEASTPPTPSETPSTPPTPSNPSVPSTPSTPPVSPPNLNSEETTPPNPSIPKKTNPPPPPPPPSNKAKKPIVSHETKEMAKAGKTVTSNKQHVFSSQKQSKADQPKILKKVVEDLIETEQQIKAGGNQIISYEKDKQENIGAIVNTFPALRKDQFGQFKPQMIAIEGKGSFVKQQPVPYVEAVENSRFPCGNYSVVVGNKYDLSVGAGGITFGTVGNSNITSGGRTIIAAAEEMNVCTGGNNNVRAGANLSLEGDSVTIKGSNQVVVDSSLGVAKNAIISGCAFVDGELYVNHITCPAEVQYTGGGLGSFGQLMTGAGEDGANKGAGGTTVIGYADMSYIKKLYNSIGASKAPWSLPDKVPVLILSEGGTDLASSAGNGGVKKNPEYSVFVYPHQHPFNNVPISFTTGNEQMREAAVGLNMGEVGTAKPISHGYKTPGQC
jgi:hypothetical protein